MWKLAAALLLTTLGSPAGAIEFKIFTANGYVAFSVEDEWLVLAMETKPPISVAAFQLPNSADEGTPESTTLSFQVFHPDSDKAREVLKGVGRQLGSAVPKTEKLQEWTVFRQEAKQGAVVYSVWDAKRAVAGANVAVQFAWPHLAGNQPDYGKQMEATFRSVLGSVHGGLGPYEPKPGEVIRRPAQ